MTCRPRLAAIEANSGPWGSTTPHWKNRLAPVSDGVSGIGSGAVALPDASVSGVARNSSGKSSSSQQPPRLMLVEPNDASCVAIVFGSGYVRLPTMMRVGFALDLAAILLLGIYGYLWIYPWFG